MADVMAGGAGRVIAEIAERVSADLIVTGTRGHSPVGGVLLGSVTQRLAASRQAAGPGRSLSDGSGRLAQRRGWH